jgi:hypothetical protein
MLLKITYLVIACRYSKFVSSSILVVLIILSLSVSIIQFEIIEAQTTTSSTDPKILFKNSKQNRDAIQKYI